MSDLDQLIRISLELEGLLRVLREHDSIDVRSALSDKFRMFETIFKEYIGDDERRAVISGQAAGGARVIELKDCEAEEDDGDEDDDVQHVEAVRDDDPDEVIDVEADNCVHEPDAEIISVPGETADEHADIVDATLEDAGSGDLDIVVVAGEGSAAIVPNIRLLHAFTLNDRYRFCRELFGGDNEDFTETLNLLSEMPGFEEAREYLINDMMWDENDAAVGEFLSILSENM